MKVDNEIRLQSDGKHDAESHSVETSRQGLGLEQRATVERISRANPTSSSMQVRRNIAVQEKAVYANPVCLSFVSQECAVAYTAMYDAAEARLYQILVNVKCCKRDKGCEVCPSVN